MFSLIITIISVALVAALALATLYYGGDAFKQGKAEAEAAQVLIQGQQVLAAAELYYLKNSKWPDTLQQLVEDQFLDAVPTAQAPVGALGEAVAAARVWDVAAAGVPVYVLPDVDTELCKMVNKKAFGKAGVPKKAYTALSAQCFGETPNEFTVVVTKNGTNLVDALPPDIIIIHPEPPPDDDKDKWIYPPDEPGDPGDPPVEPPVDPVVKGVRIEKDNPDTWRPDLGIYVKLTNTGTEALVITDPANRVSTTGTPSLLAQMAYFDTWPTPVTSGESIQLADFCDGDTLAPGAVTYCGLGGLNDADWSTGTVTLTINLGGETADLVYPEGEGAGSVATGWPSLPDDWDSLWMYTGYAQGAENWGNFFDGLEPAARVEVPFVDYFKANGHSHEWTTVLVQLKNGGSGDSYEQGNWTNGPNPYDIAVIEGTPYPTTRDHTTLLSLNEAPQFRAKDSGHLRLHSAPQTFDSTIAGMGLQRCTTGALVDTRNAGAAGCVLVLEVLEGPQPAYEDTGDGSYICTDPLGCDTHSTPHYFWGKASLKGVDQDGNSARIEFSIVVGEAHPYY